MYLLLIIISLIIIIIFPLLQLKKKRELILMSLIVFFYFSSFILFMLYISKDLGHLNKLLRYFSYSPGLVKDLMMLPIKRALISTLLNISSISFIYTNILFALKQQDFLTEKSIAKIKILSALWLIIQAILYDPYIYPLIYKLLYPKILTAYAINQFYNIFNNITTIVNVIILLLCVLAFLYHAVKFPKIRLIKYNMIVYFIAYFSIILTYSLLLYWSPTLLIRYSKVADYISYNTLSLRMNERIYPIYPYLIIILLITFLFSTFKYLKIKEKLSISSYEIMHNVNGATVSSRLFCHYMKNELLAISAMIEEIPLDENNIDIINNIKFYQQNLFNRLNCIHESLKSNKMSLSSVPIKKVIDNALESFDFNQYKNIKLKKLYLQDEILAIVDTNYVEQALINIFQNALDSMINNNKDENTLTISVSEKNNHVIIEISDTGVGISEKDMVNIFTPLFSTKPQTKNWGIGLSLAHRVITDCGGKISVKSKEDVGTSFEIQLMGELSK